MESAARRLSDRNGVVKTGIDVLEQTGYAALKPVLMGPARKIGLLTNQTDIDSESRRTIDILARVPGLSLDAIFSPEHGVTGTLDTTDLKNTTDAATGIPVYSVAVQTVCTISSTAPKVSANGKVHAPSKNPSR